MKKQTKKNEKKVKEKPKVNKENKIVVSKKEKLQPEPTSNSTLPEQELKIEPEIKEEIIEIKNEAVPEENISGDTPPIQEAIKHRSRHWKR